MRTLTLALPLSLLFLHLAAPAAHACSAPCPPRYVAPAPSATIPANTQAIVLTPWKSAGGTNPFEPTQPALISAAGVAVPTHADGALLRLDAEPEPGLYELRYANPCTHATSSAPINLGAKLPVPTAFGTISARTRDGKAREKDGRGSCTSEWNAAIVDLDFVLDPSLTPWMPIVSFSTVVDGKVWAESLPGLRTDLDLTIPNPQADFTGLPQADHLFTLCETVPSDVASKSVTPGTHTIQVTATVAGGVSLVSNELTVKFSCDGFASSKDANGGADAGPALGAGNGSVHCSMAHRRVGGWGPSAFVLFFSLPLVARRRYLSAASRESERTIRPSR